MEWYHEVWYTIKWVDFHIPNPYNTTWFQLRPQEALALRPFCVEGHRTRTTKMAGDPLQKQGSKAKTPFWDIHSSVCVITPNWPYDISLAMGPYWSYFFVNTLKSLNNRGSVPVTLCHGLSRHYHQMTPFLVVNVQVVTASHGQSRLCHALIVSRPREFMWKYWLSCTQNLHFLGLYSGV